jgi:CheR methyltransferase, all-alpha domain.
MLRINDDQFCKLTEYLKNNFGVNLIKKRTLIESRLNNYLMRNGYTNYADYLDFCIWRQNGK